MNSWNEIHMAAADRHAQALRDGQTAHLLRTARGHRHGWLTALRSLFINLLRIHLWRQATPELPVLPLGIDTEVIENAPAKII